MVRDMVGTLMEVGWGRMSEAEFMAVVHSGNRSEAGVSVPARGLTLEHISYPPELFEGL
jgi:tRNA pseudouridine38-40 synthase